MLCIFTVVSRIPAILFSRLVILLGCVCIAWCVVCPSVLAATCSFSSYVHISSSTGQLVSLDGYTYPSSVSCPDSFPSSGLNLVCRVGGSHPVNLGNPNVFGLFDCSFVSASSSNSPSPTVPFWEREIDCQLKNSIAGLLLSVNLFLTLVFGVRIVLGIVRRLLSSI